MKFIYFVPFLLLIVASCSEEYETSQFTCQGLDWDEIPYVGYIDGYYDTLFATHHDSVFFSCECNDLLTLQSFRNQHLGDYLIGFTPMQMTCAELQESCSTNRDTIRNTFNEALALVYNGGLISYEEKEIMDDFFDDVMSGSSIDFEDYKCQIELAEKDSVIQTSRKGFLSTLTIVLFQTDIEYQTWVTSSNPNHGEVDQRWRWSVFFRAGEKYVKTMKVAWVNKFESDNVFGQRVGDQLLD